MSISGILKLSLATGRVDKILTGNDAIWRELHSGQQRLSFDDRQNPVVHLSLCRHSTSGAGGWTKPDRHGAIRPCS
jgi:hypothetical protein